MFNALFPLFCCFVRRLECKKGREVIENAPIALSECLKYAHVLIGFVITYMLVTNLAEWIRYVGIASNG